MTRRNKSLMAIDTLGGAISAALVTLCLWSALVDQPQDGQSAREIAAELRAVKSEVAGLRVALAEQEKNAAQTQRELAAVGPMPDQIPPEEYLQTLSTLAGENRLSVLRQAPLAPREYPGLLEQRFAYEVAGEMHDLARFFLAVEKSPCWTDISYLKVEPGRETVDTGGRTALLTFSVFSTGRTADAAKSLGG